MGVPALLQAIYDAYRDKRLADVLSRLDDNFVLIVHLPEEIVPGGDQPRNKAAAEDIFRYFMDTFDFLSYDPGPIIVTGDRATAQPKIRYRHKPTGKILETTFRHVWQIRDGKVVALESSHDLARLRDFMDSIRDSET